MKKLLSSFLVIVISQLIFSQAGFAAVSSVERTALIALYNSTDGANWTDNSGWLGAAGTECDWYGVTCMPPLNTYVFSLDLKDNNLTGSIPSEIGNLSRMALLQLQDNQLAGDIPPEFINLIGIRKLMLNLSNNRLYSTSTAVNDFINSKLFGGDWASAQDTSIAAPSTPVTPATPVTPETSVPEPAPTRLGQTEVSQLYVAIFGRASEGEGNSYWQNDENSTGMPVTADLMLATGAAQSYFGTTLNDDVDFITHIYINTLGKTYDEDPEGIDYWVSELGKGKSKGEVIAALITAAQHPDNWGAAQDRFNNKVAASNYCANTIAKFTNNLDTFKKFIDVITDDDTTLSMAKGLIETEDVGFGENGDDDIEDDSLLQSEPVNDDQTLIVFEKWLRKEKDPSRPNITTYGNPELWLINGDGSNMQRLTQGHFDSEAAWAADGERIAFTRANIDGAIDGPFVINSDGSGLVQAYGHGGHYPGWVDSNTLLYTAGHPWAPYLVSIDSQQARVIDFGILDTFSHRISPDGQYVAFSGSADADNKRQIYVGDISGGNLLPLRTISGALKGWAQLWTEEGLYVAGSDEGSCVRIEVNRNESDQAFEIINDVDECALSFSPSGENAVYVDNRDIWVMDANGQNKRKIATSDSLSFFSNPRWSPK